MCFGFGCSWILLSDDKEDELSAVKAAVFYSIENVDYSFGIGGLSVRYPRLRSHFPQYSSKLSRSTEVVHELLLAY